MGQIISFSGVNGIGKTTQVKVLEEYFKKSNKKVLRTQKLFQYFLLAPLLKVAKSSMGSSSGKVTKSNKNQLLKIWFIPAFFDIWIGYVFRVRPLMQKYDYILADRDYSDMWISLKYYQFMPSWAFKAGLPLLPRPSVSLLFLADPGIVEKRETGFSKNYYREQSRLYEVLKERPRTITINSNGHIKTVSQVILRFAKNLEE